MGTAMLIEQINHIGLEPFERGVHRLFDVAAWLFKPACFPLSQSKPNLVAMTTCRRWKHKPLTNALLPVRCYLLSADCKAKRVAIRRAGERRLPALANSSNWVRFMLPFLYGLKTPPDHSLLGRFCLPFIGLVFRPRTTVPPNLIL